MNSKLVLLVLLLATCPFIYGQNSVIVHPKNSYVRENLDLNYVSSIYSQALDLADFEERLNYPEERISNLDLNNDGKVDYLRVSEKIVNNVKIILIQAEMGSNIYEDVATINIVLKQKSSYSTDSGLKPKDIIVPFVCTALNILFMRN